MPLTINNSLCQVNAYNKQKRHHLCRLRLQMKQSLRITYNTALRHKNCRIYAHLFVLVVQLPSRRRIQAVAHAQKSLAHSFGSTNHWFEYRDGHGTNYSFERPLAEVCQFFPVFLCHYDRDLHRLQISRIPPWVPQEWSVQRRSHSSTDSCTPLERPPSYSPAGRHIC